MIKRKLLSEVTITDFSEYTKVTNKRRPVYYIKGKCRIPKKYLNDKYGFNSKDRLYNIETGEEVVKNINSVNKPRLKKVNGQSIYNSNVHRQARATLVKSLHEYFKPYLRNIDLPNDINIYPLTMELIYKVHDMGKNNIDNDNKWIWRKVIQDTLVELGIISDDNVHIISRNEEETVLISGENPQELTINIYTNYE